MNQYRDTARSQHGYLIYNAGGPILWKSQLQSECNLSSTESTVLTDIERGSVRIYGSSRTVRTNPLDQIGNWEISSFTWKEQGIAEVI